MKKLITVVRLVQDTYVGKSLDLNKTLTNGGSVDGVPIELDFHDERFLSVRFTGKTKEQKYVQLIPWASVATVMYDEVK